MVASSWNSSGIIHNYTEIFEGGGPGESLTPNLALGNKRSSKSLWAWLWRSRKKSLPRCPHLQLKTFWDRFRQGAVWKSSGIVPASVTLFGVIFHHVLSVFIGHLVGGIMEFISVRVLNWGKYNPRRDYTKPWWFACNNRLLEDPDFYGLSHSQIVSWIYVLSQASIQKSENVRLNLAHADRACGIKAEILRKSLSIFEKLQLIQIQDGICTESVLYITEQNKQNRTNNIAQKLERESFLEGIYKTYPRKVGKSRGLKTLATQIECDEDRANLTAAVKNYADYVVERGIEEKFIKHFSTFANEWRDWVVKPLAPAISAPKVSTARRFYD